MMNFVYQVIDTKNRKYMNFNNFILRVFKF